MHVTEWKKPILKGFRLCAPKCVTFKKMQNYVANKISGYQGYVGGED